MLTTGHVHVSTAIMTHPARLGHAERLRDENPELDAAVIVDPDPGAVPSAMRSARLAWAAVPPHATHHLVLQDDVAVSRWFPAELARAVAARPGTALSLFSEWGSRSTHAARIAALAGASWVGLMADYVPTQALVLPAAEARRLARFLTEECTDYDHDDAAVHRYLVRSGVDALLAVPNLVDHRDVPSLHGNGSWGPRPSGCYLPDPAARADFPDWTGPALRPDLVPYLPRIQYLSRPLCLVRCSDSWDSLAAADYLAICGMPPADQLRGMLAALAGRPALREQVGFGLLHDLWLVACVIGVAFTRPGATAGADGCATRLRRAMGTSVARLALATTAGGVLRDRLDGSVLDRLGPQFEQFVRTAVAFGACRAAAGGTAS